MNKKQLLEALKSFPEDAPIIVRTFERGEVSLTVDLTGVSVFEKGGVLLTGDLEIADGSVH